MDKQLQEAAERGDVDFFIQRYEAGSYFFPDKIQLNRRSNLLHVASSKGHLDFVVAVLERLPVQALVCQPDKQEENPLHCAAREGHLDIAKLLVEAYRSSTDHPADQDWIVKAIESEVGVPSCPPWRAVNLFNRTPVHVAAFRGHEKLAKFLHGFLGNVDNYSSSLLIDAAFGGCTEITNQISIKLTLHDILGFATEHSEDAVLLLKKHPQLVRCCYPGDSGPKRNTILHGAAGHNLVSVIETVLNIDNTIANIVDKEDQYPLHISVKRGHFEIAEVLIDAFNKSFGGQQKGEIEEVEEVAAEGSPLRARISGQHHGTTSGLSLRPPWRGVDINGSTPLHLAVKQKHQKTTELILMSDLAFLLRMANECNQHRPSQLVRDVADSDRPGNPCRFMNIYFAAFHRFLREKLENKTDGDAARKLIQKYQELIRYDDKNGRTILQYLLDENDTKTMSFILEIDPSAIQGDQGSVEHLLFRACRKLNLPAIQTICQICPQAAQHLGREDNTTALHHVGPARTAKEYRKLLDIPEIEDMKNDTDKNKRTPLMKAIQENKLALAKALLTMKGIDTLNTRNMEGKTAADMLKSKSKHSPEWKKLYKEVSLIAKSHLKEMRSTMSIVAALLATITFAAAFTVPGGFNQNNGYVIFGQKASFIVFLLSDTYAMCCSMIVLYSLIWATYQDSDKSLKTVNRSIKVLHQSLYGTMGAFMAGVYTMMSSKSIWVAFVILFMCSSVVVFSCMLIDFKYNFGKLIRRLNTLCKKDQGEGIESGETLENNIESGETLENNIESGETLENDIESGETLENTIESGVTLENASAITKRRGGVQTSKEGNSNQGSSISRTPR